MRTVLHCTTLWTTSTCTSQNVQQLYIMSILPLTAIRKTAGWVLYWYINKTENNLKGLEVLRKTATTISKDNYYPVKQ